MFVMHSVFETTIRYLGGLLSAYELRGEVDEILLTKAQEVADKLAYAWVDVRNNTTSPSHLIVFTANRITPSLSASSISPRTSRKSTL